MEKQSIIPIPRVPINVRPGTMEDVPFMDSLQKLHTKQVGWMPTKQLEGKIQLGHVLVAEGSGIGVQGLGMNTSDPNPEPQTLNPVPVGYVIGRDQYFKRDDCGIIYQLNVTPNRQRGLIGATLIKAMFDRAAWGCRLFCCWCAQDIEANYFWEAMGFIPLAFRAGSATSGRKGGARVHIFWQKRIRQGDVTTPYWFPAQTAGGSIREDRLVLPIPPGTHWRDEMPCVLPNEKLVEEPKRLPGKRTKQQKFAKAPGPKYAITHSKLHFAAPSVPAIKSKPACTEGTRRAPRVKSKNDPKFVAAARELRDRWLEQVNADPSTILPVGKYDLSRQLPRGESNQIQQLPELRAA